MRYNKKNKSTNLSEVDLNSTQETTTSEITHQSVTSLNKRTASQTLAWGTMQTVIMAVVARTASEFTCPEKSLEAAFILAVVVPLSVEYFKQMFNLTDAVKKHFVFNAKSNAAQVICLALLAGVLYGTDSNKDFSPIGYDASIIIPGIVLKLMFNYAEAELQNEANVDQTTTTNGDIVNPLFPQDEESRQISEPSATNILPMQHVLTCGNWSAMHIAARLPLLFCATNAGGQFFEAMQIPLAEGLEAAGLTNFAGLVAFSVILNEVIGSHLFKASGVFKEVHPNLIPRLLTMVALAGIFQNSGIMKDVNMVNFVAAYLIGFVTDLLVDTVVEKTGVGVQIENGMSALLSRGYACLQCRTRSDADESAYSALASEP